MNCQQFINKSEIYRYLGLGKCEPNDVLEALIEEGIGRVSQHAVLRSISGEARLEIQNDHVTVGSILFRSGGLAEHLYGCQKVILFAATLGSGIDRLLIRDSVLRPSLAVVEQAVAAAMIESYADDCCKTLQKDLPQGQYLRSRYSPGYGDLSLEAQRPLLDMLNASRCIGVSLTDSLMLTPMKSISAFVGIGDQKPPCRTHSCAACSKTDCMFRKDE